MNKLIDILIERGLQGAEAAERYLDIPETVTFYVNEERWRACQISYFSDTKELMVYSIDDYNEGLFTLWSDLDESTQKDIEQQFNN